MKRKIVTLLLAVCTAMCLCFGLTACGGGEDSRTEHTHTYSAEWTYDETYHWHAATCEHTGEVSVKSEHTYVAGVCSVCGHKQSTPVSNSLDFTINSDNSSYSVTGKGTCTDGNVVIPAEYNKLPVTSIGDSAFENFGSLTSITIPDSVTSIGESAFYGCSMLTNITIPNSVTFIGDSAFYGTAYYNNQTNWENGVFYIGKHLIEAETSLSGTYAIKQETLTIGSSAFHGCSGLTSVTIPDGVTSIGDSAFYGCRGLTSITIPDSVTSIGDFAFNGCSSLNYNEYDNANYLGNETNPYVVLVRVAFTYIASCSINTNTKMIYNSAFEDCGSLTSITIPDGVTSIGNRAFYDSALASITIPDSVTSIGYSAFYDCSVLESIIIPDSVTSIGYSAFYGCSMLESVTFENTEGWWLVTSSEATSGTSVDVSDPVQNVTYLTSTYYNYYWRRG